jgi:hypothetical protein
MRITARDIQDLLRAKHAKDVYVSECKSGPTYPGYLRLDGWAMKKSWVSPMVTGYEIKVSRADFLQDTKYLEYRAYCNALFVVAPKGILFLEELPEGVGYYQVATTGSKLFCKRKAQQRTDPIPEEIYRYILMARAKILKPTEMWREEDGDSKRAFFENWLKEKKVDFALGRKVSRSLSARIEEEVIEAQHKNRRLQELIERLEPLRAVMKELGVPESGWRLEDTFQSALDKKLNGARQELERSISNAVTSLEFISQQIKEQQ